MKRFKSRLRTLINSLLEPHFAALAKEMRRGFGSIDRKENAVMDAIGDIKAGWDNFKGAVTQAATDIEAAAGRLNHLANEWEELGHVLVTSGNRQAGLRGEPHEKAAQEAEGAGGGGGRGRHAGGGFSP